jgi:hypothetical protein
MVVFLAIRFDVVGGSQTVIFTISSPLTKVLSIASDTDCNAVTAAFILSCDCKNDNEKKIYLWTKDDVTKLQLFSFA